MSEEERSYLSGAIRHYSSLFSFPSYPVILMTMFVVVTMISAGTFLLASPSLGSLLRGAIFALETMLLPTVCADFIVSRLRIDTVLTLRRLAALSAVTNVFWATMAAFGTAIYLKTGLLGLVPSIFLGASLMIGFRFLVIRSITSPKPLNSLTAVFLHPILCLGVMTALWSSPPYLLILAMFVSASLLILAGCLILRAIDKHGERSIGIGGLTLFRSFLSDWLEGAADPLEDNLEKLAVPAEASTSLLEFSGENGALGTIVVSDIHPGPFRNIGSSNLPFQVQTTLEDETKAPVIVPHGTSGHERDLASKRHCKKLIDSLAVASSANSSSALVSPMVRVASGEAHASCQLFENVALVTVTCAPQSMEDIPFEIGREIIDRGKALGAEDVVVIDSHNSIGNANEVPILLPEQLSDIKVAAETVIKGALKSSKGVFKFGASRIIPKEFGLREGLGSGGIAVAVVEVRGQRVAYVTFDGNNMVRGLRDEIRDSLRDMVDDSEVLTTDTHFVNGVSTIERGYRPVGEVGSHEVLLSHVRRCTSEALSQLRESRFAYRRINVPGLLVIGEEKLRSLSLLVDSSAALLKRLAILFYGPTIILTIVLFLLL